MAGAGKIPLIINQLHRQDNFKNALLGHSCTMIWCDPFVRNRLYKARGWAAKDGYQLSFDNFRLMLVR